MFVLRNAHKNVLARRRQGSAQLRPTLNTPTMQGDQRRYISQHYSQAAAQNDLSQRMPITLPLILMVIILILIILLCIQSSVIPLRAGQIIWREDRGSLRLEGEEQPFVTDEGQDIPHRNDDQSQSTRDHTVDHLNNQWRPRHTIPDEHFANPQRDMSASASHNAELQRQIEILSRDLQGARVFLTTADSFSDSEIIQMLQKLNAELQHTSTIMADRAVTVFKLGHDVTPSTPEQQGSVSRASESIGSTLAQSLRNTRPDDLPMYLQIAFQAFLTHRMGEIVSSWTIDEERNTFMSEIYQRMRETERQAVFARWRSLTRTYALPTCVSEPSSFVTPIVAGLSDILSVVGCTTSQPEVVSELLSAFETNISSIVSLAVRLNQMIGGVISGDFEVFPVRPGQPFVEAMMEEDTDGGGDGWRGTQGETEGTNEVLCTSELGLTKRVQSAEKKVVTNVVIKAKVILKSFLDAEY